MNFSNWSGLVIVNNEQVDPSFDLSQIKGSLSIKLLPKGFVPRQETKRSPSQEALDISSDEELIITVKDYMRQKSTPDFSFMANFNNDIPMPLKTMVGIKVKESPKMWYMKLHGDIIAKTVDVCMCCGKPLDNPVSRYFGMGPVCGGHNYTNPFDSDQELEEAVKTYRDKLMAITWEGWIPKSAIVKEVKRNGSE